MATVLKWTKRKWKTLWSAALTLCCNETALNCKRRPRGHLLLIYCPNACTSLKYFIITVLQILKHALHHPQLLIHHSRHRHTVLTFFLAPHQPYFIPTDKSPVTSPSWGQSSSDLQTHRDGGSKWNKPGGWGWICWFSPSTAFTENKTPALSKSFKLPM